MKRNTLGFSLFQMVAQLAAQTAAAAGVPVPVPAGPLPMPQLPPPPPPTPAWVWADDFSTIISGADFDAGFRWSPAQEGGGSEGAPGRPAGWFRTRCDYGSEGYGCSTDTVEGIYGYHNLRDRGLWLLTDANSVTWNYLSARGGGDVRMDSQAFGKAMLAEVGNFITSRGDLEAVRNGIRTMLAGLNPQFVEGMANAIADYYNKYWSQEQSHGFFGDFFRGAFGFVGELLQVPPIRAALAAISLGSSEIAVEGASLASEQIAAELATEAAMDFAPEFAFEAFAPEFAFEAFAPELAVELAPEFAAELAPELVSEIVAPEVAVDVATEGSMDFLDFGDEFLDFGDDLFFEVDALPE